MADIKIPAFESFRAFIDWRAEMKKEPPATNEYTLLQREHLIGMAETDMVRKITGLIPPDCDWIIYGNVIPELVQYGEVTKQYFGFLGGTLEEVAAKDIPKLRKAWDGLIKVNDPVIKDSIMTIHLEG